VLDQIEVQLTYRPDVETRNRKRLRPNPLAPWELRIGEIRVFYDVNADAVSVRGHCRGAKGGQSAHHRRGGDVVMKRIALESCSLSVQELAKLA